MKSLFRTLFVRGYLIELIFILTLGMYKAQGQQDPQYTQYMYNTQIVNPAYAGSREVLSMGILGRMQWVNLEGAPRTGTFTMNTPIGALQNMGLGLSIVYDQIGPATESNINVDYSYSVQLDKHDISKLSFGLKAGIDLLDVDYEKLNLENPNDPLFQNTVDNKIQPQIGAGIYYHTQKFYAGFSVPNFLNSKHFDAGSLENQDLENIAIERLHYFFITGYVFDLSPNLKFKPATMVKFVSGSPLQWDMSANFMINEKFILGGSYRWNSSISALAGFQISQSVFIGLAYDYDSTQVKDYTSGSYEAMVRFDIFHKTDKVLTPRFF
ncbi:type IX secretion system membrane protein PorP/SprF [Flagellimonas alvinocaridis]|uniref:Type IX secretion system membrane protein PorP/SprF n=1 Tax=Flagellimonas alvinocaridis TaxID=2530200 RepID=A0A4S8RH23_9FLAO|nr:type IX secretion system membrane protein PorP/SprF [Allomuricauda alvinocaridis]THV57643.1 type IX secretion system membrane protein PorP/SprF [Allomuricauda alvinocaridis]